MSYILVEKRLMDRFLEICSNNGYNSRWAVNTLEHEVYTLHKDEYLALEEEDRNAVDHFFSALRKLHGEKQHGDL